MTEALTEAEQQVVRQSAVERCSHPDEWVSATETGYTADACWSCLLDALFDHWEASDDG